MCRAWFLVFRTSNQINLSWVQAEWASSDRSKLENEYFLKNFLDRDRFFCNFKGIFKEFKKNVNDQISHCICCFFHKMYEKNQNIKGWNGVKSSLRKKSTTAHHIFFCIIYPSEPPLKTTFSWKNSPRKNANIC